MSATADRPAAATGAAEQPVLSRADGLELLGEVSGSGYKDGAALVRRADGQMVQLGPLMYALLEEIDGRRDHAELAAAMSERLRRGVEAEHVVRLGEKLGEQGLLTGSEDNAPPRMNPLLALRWKVLVTDSKLTNRITAPFENLFRPWILLPMLAGFAVVFWFVLIHKGVASATAQAFANPELLLLVLVLGIASAGFHEIGHASACRYGGGRPGGMGAGIYVVWPAFYTDVTDAYRLPKRARLRTDLGGLYFNAVVAVLTLGVWLALRVDALLLLIALQLLEMVKQLSPVIRADGYHILSDATGVPDLYAHIGPTLRRLLPWRSRERSALTGRARVLVTAWVLVIVPVLISMSLSAILLLPKLVATTWDSGSHIASGIPDQASGGHVLPLLASVVRLIALALPVVGTVLMSQRVVATVAGKAGAWSAGRPARRAALALGTAALAGLMAWAWWPAGQYQPVRASDQGTLQGVGRLVASPARVARPAQPQAAAPVRLAPGRHLAVAMIPVGGATKEHPAIFVIKGHDGQKPAIVVSGSAPSTKGTPSAHEAPGAAPTATSSTATAGGAPSGAAGAPSSTTTPSSTAGSATTSSTAQTPVRATAFPFKLPDKPGPHDSQALATNATDGGIKYNVVYSLVTVRGGQTVDEVNSAYALASCKACTTVAVSFQLVLIIGQTRTIKPINVAEALNVNCPSCVTTAIADQIVVTITAEPPAELLQRLTAELQKLDAISQLGAGGSPAAVAAEVGQVQDEIQHDLDASGLLAGKPTRSGAGNGAGAGSTMTTPSPGTSTATTTPSSGASSSTPSSSGSGAAPGTSTTSSDPPAGASPSSSTPASGTAPTPSPSGASSTTPADSGTPTGTSSTPAPTATDGAAASPSG
jgi:putative peptide zinc metalloprotease protein